METVDLSPASDNAAKTSPAGGTISSQDVLVLLCLNAMRVYICRYPEVFEFRPCHVVFKLSHIAILEMPPSGNIKYRAACDHCSTTKIKCSQERPQCARCRALGRNCHYSRSLRAGKPPRSSQGLNKKLLNAPVLPRHDSIPEIGPLSQTSYSAFSNNHFYSPISPCTKQNPAWTAHSAPYPTPPAHGLGGHTEIPYYPDFTIAEHSLTSATPLEPDWIYDFDKSSHLLNDTRTSSLDSSMTSTSQQPSPRSDRHRTPPDYMDMNALPNLPDASQQPPPIPGFPTTPSHGHSCIKIATDALTKLYEIPTLHIDSTTTHTTVDQVLSTTSRAVQTCHHLLSSQYPKDFHLPVLIATILSKVLAWYQAVAWIQDSPTDGSSSAAGSGSDTKDSNAKEIFVDDHQHHQHRHLRHLAPSGGAPPSYRLDDEMGWTLRNHIVHGRLQKLNETVCLYHETFGLSGGGAAGNESAAAAGGGTGGTATATAVGSNVVHQSDSSQNLYLTMGSFVKARLQSTMRELDRRLAPGSSTGGLAA